MSELRRIPLKPFLSADAQRLIRARKEGQHLHKSGDVRASGNQVEVVARQIFKDRLSARHRITHGHAVDYRGFVSPQIDIIIADAFHQPALFQANDGTEYVAYESVFALGEVKSSFDKSKAPLEQAISTVQKIRTGLFRSSTHRNPLFYFLLFVQSGDLALNEVAALFRETPVEDLPNITCWMDQGLIMYCKFAKNGLGELIPVHYLLSPSTDSAPGDEPSWIFTPWGREQDREGSNLAALIGLVTQFIESCVLSPPNTARDLMFLMGEKYLVLK